MFFFPKLFNQTNIQLLNSNEPIKSVEREIEGNLESELELWGRLEGRGLVEEGAEAAEKSSDFQLSMILGSIFEARVLFFTAN